MVIAQSQVKSVPSASTRTPLTAPGTMPNPWFSLTGDLADVQAAQLNRC